MDEDGLPIVGPGIDYNKVEAIQQKRTVAFLNHFITHTVGFLNRFSSVCENKLENISNRICQLEVTLNILEAKLSSIPGLESLPSPSINKSSVQSDEIEKKADEPKTEQDKPTEIQVQVKVEDAKPTMTVSQDPQFARFFKMLQVGVPLMAVKNKMTAEGLNPDLLDNPDAAAPAATHMTNGSNDDSDSDMSSVSSFSD